MGRMQVPQSTFKVQVIEFATVLWSTPIGRVLSLFVGKNALRAGTWLNNTKAQFAAPRRVREQNGLEAASRHRIYPRNLGSSHRSMTCNLSAPWTVTARNGSLKSRMSDA